MKTDRDAGQPLQTQTGNENGQRTDILRYKQNPKRSKAGAKPQDKNREQKQK